MTRRLPRPEPMGAVDYMSTMPPAGYHCGQCGALGVKLWREYQTILSHQSLLCAKCACAEQTKPAKSYSIRAVDGGGVCVTTIYDAVLEPKLHKIFGGSDDGGDQIGWRIPAVPTTDGRTYWGYSSVPEDGVRWWKSLPLSKESP